MRGLATKTVVGPLGLALFPEDLPFSLTVRAFYALLLICRYISPLQELKMRQLQDEIKEDACFSMRSVCFVWKSEHQKRS